MERIRVFFREHGTQIRNWTILAVLILLFVEASMHLTRAVINRVSSTDPHWVLDEYYKQPYTKGLFADHVALGKLKKEYVPYVEWEGREFHGAYMNIDQDGTRRTANPEALPETRKTVFMFGGSTTWGTGVRDEYTLPSRLSAELNAEKPRYFVKNYGQEGYTMRQGLIKLETLLISGTIPDYVIFYDGVNNTGVAYMEGRPGGILNRGTLESRFEDSSASLLAHDFVGGLKKYCRLCRAAGGLVRLVTPSAFREHIEASGYSKEELEALGREVVHDYARTLEILDLLSEKYGFKYLALWQPTLFLEPKLVGDETKLASFDVSVSDPNPPVMYREEMEALKTAVKNPHFFEITNVLQGREKGMYIDSAHLTGDGNARVAKRISEIFTKSFGRVE